MSSDIKNETDWLKTFEKAIKSDAFDCNKFLNSIKDVKYIHKIICNLFHNPPETLNSHLPETNM